MGSLDAIGPMDTFFLSHARARVFGRDGLVGLWCFGVGLRRDGEAVSDCTVATVGPLRVVGAGL